MGNSLLSPLKCFLGYCPQMKLVMVDLDRAGKTTMMYRLKLDTMLEYIPSVGFNVETIRYRNFEFVMWDIGAHGRMHLLWSHYFQRKNAPKALIYVVESADRERVEEAGEELRRLCYEDDIKILLILANKQDHFESMTIENIREEMKLNTILKRIEWNIVGCSAKTGDGLYEAIDWLVDILNQK